MVPLVNENKVAVDGMARSEFDTGRRWSFFQNGLRFAGIVAASPADTTDGIAAVPATGCYAGVAAGTFALEVSSDFVDTAAEMSDLSGSNSTLSSAKPLPPSHV